MELLLKEEKIKWQGSLKATYNKYFHPDTLEMSNQKMFKMLFDGEIISSFQFETITGRQVLEKVKAKTFDEISAANSLMRLTTDGEQPVDKYVRYKNDSNEWTKDMNAYGLNNKEQNVLIEILSSRYGVCDTQELLMLLSMHKDISSFNLKEANLLRKSVAKKDPKKQEEQKKIFYEHGLKNGTRKCLLDYVWNECFTPTFGYAFSLPHIAGYTLILMIEMNIAFKYGSIFWKTACLTVDSGIVGDQERTTNYGKNAKALENFKSEILPPSLNKSDVGFTPDLKQQKIVFGLKPITGINIETAEEIINNRPYKSFNDFYEKNVENGLLTNKKLITLIKSGLFDEVISNRKALMVNYVKMINPPKKKLTAANISKIITNIPNVFKNEIELYNFFQEIKKNKTHNKLMDKYLSDYKKDCEDFTTKKYDKAYYYDNDGNFIIEKKVFEKYYKKKAEKLLDWLKTDEAVKIEQSLRCKDFWKENCMGSLAQWEMESINFYIHKHELDEYPLNDIFNIENFNKLPEEPIYEEVKSSRGNIFKNFKTYEIAGTVVDTLPNKGIAILITQFGVVQARIGKGRFQYYNKKIMQGTGSNRVNIDDSWFKRGTKLVCVGYRRNTDFICNSRNSPYPHSLMRINGVSNSKLIIQTEKKKA